METMHTWQEITSQPEVWRATLEQFTADRAGLESLLQQTQFDQIAAIGCGSTHYLAQAAAAALSHCTGIPSRPFPSSELWLFPSSVPAIETLLLAISRSGTTTETLRALARFREAGAGPVLTITCYPDSPLAQQADFVLAAPAAQEQSVAQTRSFASMFLLTQLLSALLARNDGMLERLRRLPNALQSLVERLGDLPKRLGEDTDVEQFFFLGGGPLYGLANEVMLKMKEMTLSHSEAYHPLEFRHGPMSMVTGRTLVVGLLSDTGLAQELRVLEDMARLGARTLALIEDASAFGRWQPDDVVELRSGLTEWERGALYLPVLQRLAYHRSVAKGLNPDRPRNLEAVVEL
jgi:glucosamine--fructose-6-phosphate aminotransferase (isomerizing)